MDQIAWTNRSVVLAYRNFFEDLPRLLRLYREHGYHARTPAKGRSTHLVYTPMLAAPYTPARSEQMQGARRSTRLRLLRKRLLGEHAS
eukprot:6188655-Pleurochrysis_carterae.AAC.2